MGLEYSIQFAWPDRATIERVLRAVPGIAVLDTSPASFELRSGDDPSTMRLASLQPTADGLYFCDWTLNGACLYLVVAYLLAEFGTVTVAQLQGDDILPFTTTGEVGWEETLERWLADQ